MTGTHDWEGYSSVFVFGKLGDMSAFLVSGSGLDKCSRAGGLSKYCLDVCGPRPRLDSAELARVSGRDCRQMTLTVTCQCRLSKGNVDHATSLTLSSFPPIFLHHTLHLPNVIAVPLESASANSRPNALLSALNLASLHCRYLLSLAHRRPPSVHNV
jgi:hypothetical protein